ncbi:MAG: MFS transporter [Limimaricola sp.]|uniref:MFS transporter n=1 Tax=Limimaricola sp. TaxID=2211665 RepID=UPI001D353A8D|nr:MFS transporter [Limimaricola sp.]MBI1418651.1 MFS transporter [Limimaricola sp.]
MFDKTRALARSNPGLGTLLLAQCPADFADWLDFVAIGTVLAYRWQAPPVAFAWFAVALGLPYLTIGVLAGAVVDRMDLRRVMILGNLGRALGSAALILAPDWPALVIVVALRASADSFYSPAKQASLQAIVAGRDLLAANGLSFAINQGAKIVAPALGGALIAVLAPQDVFAVNAGVSVLAAALLLPMRPLPRRATGGTSLWRDIAESLRLLRTTPVLRAAIGMMAAGIFAIFLYDTLFAPTLQALGASPMTFGLCMAAVGAGGVLGGATVGKARGTSGSFSMIAAAAGLSGLVTIGVGCLQITGMFPPALLLIGLFGLLGLLSARSVVPTRALLQDHTPPGGMGRVAALSEAANTLALLVAPFLGAALAASLGYGAAFVAGGVLMLGVALIASRLAAQFSDN